MLRFPYPKALRRLSTILTRKEAVQLIDSASNLFQRAMLMTVYSTGMRRAEMCNLKVEDLDSDRMVIHIRQGKGQHDAPPSSMTGGSVQHHGHRSVIQFGDRVCPECVRCVVKYLGNNVYIFFKRSVTNV